MTLNWQPACNGRITATALDHRFGGVGTYVVLLCREDGKHSIRRERQMRLSCECVTTTAKWLGPAGVYTVAAAKAVAQAEAYAAMEAAGY